GWRHRLKDGTIIDVDISSHTIDLEGRHSALVIAQDVTERKKAEARVRYLTRLYATLSQVNQAIVRVGTRDELFQSICEVAVRFGEFHLAWIGLVNRETGVVEPSAVAGHGRDYLDSLVINIEEGPFGRGPTGTAIRSGKVEFSDSIADDKRMKPWRDAALKRGFHSSAAVPIRQSGQIIGTLNLYAREPGFFSEEERTLLEEIGLDISYALDRITTESERERAEEALRASERRYRQLFEQNQAGVYYTSFDGTIIDCNEAFARILGYESSEEIKKHRATELYFDNSERAAYLEMLKEHGSLTDFELRLKRKDGSPVWILENVSVATGDSGQVLNTQGTLIDITERKLAEEALRASEKRYRQLFENNQAGVFYTSLDGHILGCNEKFAQLFGYSTSEEMRQHSAKELYFDVETRNAYLEELQKTGSLTNYELRLKRKDGSPIWILENINIGLDEYGKPTQVHGTLIDITERKSAEEALRASQRNYQSLAETMTALHETTRDLVSERDLTKLLHTIVERAARLLNTYAGGLYLADPQNRRVKCLVSYNTPRDYTGVELDYGEGAAGLVAQTEEPLIINDYSQWSGRAKVYENEKPFQAVLSVPMKWQDELIGVIHMLDYGGVREFTEADKDLMLLFANQAAIAAKNASLYTQAREELAERKQAEQLQEAVYRIAQTAQLSES
ncbi:MAG: PAS domain S-box protein, partial [Chloroflexota bacterium]